MRAELPTDVVQRSAGAKVTIVLERYANEPLVRAAALDEGVATSLELVSAEVLPWTP